MPALKLEQFGGVLPAWDKRLLPTGQAASAQNGYLFSGALAGWRKPKILRALNNSAARYVYRIPTVAKTQARAYLIWLGNPSIGDTVSIGDLTYTLRASITSASLPFDVLIGTTPAETLTNLAHAITADSGKSTNAGVQYGPNTPLNVDVRYFLPDTDPISGLTDPQVGSDTVGDFLMVGAEDFGAAFNSIAVASSNPAALLWLYDLASVAHTTSTYVGGTNPTFNDEITAASSWLEFTDPDTNVFKSPIVDDQWNRFYVASPSQSPQYNTYDRIVASDPFWLLGVPPPGCAVSLEVTGGGNNLQLGNVTVSGGRIDGRPNFVYLMKVTTPGDTQIQQVTFLCHPVGTPADGYPDAHFAAVVYTDLDGKPQDLLNTGHIKTGVQASAPNVSAFVNPTSLLGNTPYWIGFMIDTAVALAGGPAGGSSVTSQFSNTFTNGPPAIAPNSSLARTQLTSDGTNVQNGDRVVIGLNEYLFQTTLTNVPGHVHIGVNADASLANLEHCINASGGTPGTDYAASSSAALYVVSGAVTAHAIEITAKNNTIPYDIVTTTFIPISLPAHLAFDATTLLPGFAAEQPGLCMYGDFVTSDIIESRSYVYTWVSEYGEEGPPSPPTLLDGWSNGVWTMGLWQPPINDLGVLRNLKKLNIYRTVPGKGGQTVFFFVESVDIGTAKFIDTKPNNDVALNDQLASTNWFPPPENLQGFTVMQNGMVAAFQNNEVWFCEPFRPHAWPPQYVVTTDYPIVGMGVTNGALVICTAEKPYVLSGSAPTSMIQTKCSQANPCLSRGSILDGDGAVSYMSPNGMIQVTAGAQATNTTDLWFTRENWRTLTPQHDARCIYLASAYFCYGTLSRDLTDTSVAQQGFTIELDQDNTSFSIWPQPGGHRLGFMPLNSHTGYDISNVITDPWTATGLLVSNGSVWYYDFSDAAPEMVTYTWRSKLYMQNTRRSYSAIKVFFAPDLSYVKPTLNATIVEEEADNTVWQTLPADRWGYVRTYADFDGDGELELVDCREIRSSGELLRIIGGFKSDTWQWEITANVAISNVQIGTSVKELAQV